MTTHRFRTEVELHGRTATGLRVPAAVVEALGQGKKPKVTVTINGHAYRSTVAVYEGDFFLPLNGENRKAAGVAAGEIVEVQLEPDLAERTVEVPDDLAEALTAQPGARAAFDALSFSRRRAHVEAVNAAKKAETRERRITAIAEELGG
ncbi:YdeI/OmpD-associated family protein [Kineosporia babensis]|uniref:YdeI/OmpD-associated family protein n=1 Tax=Kineosporia babensis TaxID=499548 RepID=A0A9X1SUE8_9ACTN|nr:YdeI/OmpD-associated family protein [Kineosporia babensis]MCD5312882.1 YdeI/OmpD-associated family protein [Kineosporia babensis]